MFRHVFRIEVTICLFVEPAKIDILAGQKNHAPVKVRHTTFRFSTGKVTIYNANINIKTDKIHLQNLSDKTKFRENKE
jgi:hypothetical protein